MEHYCCLRSSRVEYRPSCVYSVQMSKRVPASIARERFADLLDAAEAGQPVIIERRGVRYSLAKVTEGRPPRRRRALVTAVDAAVADGQWTWDWGRDGLTFSKTGKS